MEMRPPTEYRKSELPDLTSDIVIFASDEDIFFPANKVFPKAGKLFVNKPLTYQIEGKHLPSEATMLYVCNRIGEFLDKKV